MSAAALFQAALQAHDAGDLDAAEAGYRAALEQWPLDANLLDHLAVLLLERERWEEGIALLDRSLAIDPSQAGMLVNRGNALIRLGRFDEALASYERAIALQPGAEQPAAYNNLAVYLQGLGLPAEATAFYDKALALRPLFAEAWGNRGSSLLMVDRADEALASLDRAIALSPGYVDAITNRGVALYRTGRAAEAIAAYDQALALAPDYADAHWNKAHALLLSGDYAAGWRAFEWRWRRADAPPQPRFDYPLWLGEESLEGRTILLHAEQGLGDTIQMLRYVPQVVARGARVVLAVPPTLTGLAGSVAETVALQDTAVVADFHCPLMSLPLALGARIDAAPADVPYLSAPAARIADWQARLGPKTRRRIGLAWSGNPTHTNDRNRSIPLQTLLPLLAAEADFVSLQRDYREADAAVLGRIADWSGALADFTDTAALIEALDLVITADTSVAHLAGALGKPVWILLPWLPDYRWGLKGETSPWYPTARLFRQERAGDWGAVAARVLAALG